MPVSLPGFPSAIDNLLLKLTEQSPDEFPFLQDHNSGRPPGLDNQRLTAAKEVILSAGAVNTPHLLLNSGIGDKKTLTAIGIKSVLDLPSVGRNLSDHPLTTVIFGSVPSSDIVGNLVTNVTLQNEALAQWQKNRTGPLVSTGTFVDWERLPSSIFKKFDDPSPGPNSPHIEIDPSSGASLATSGQPAIGSVMVAGIEILSPTSRGSVTLDKTNPLGNPLSDTSTIVGSISLGSSRFRDHMWGMMKWN